MIGIFSDAHGDLRGINKITGVNSLICCGDLSSLDNKYFRAPVYTILGNHEEYNILEILKRHNEKISNLTIMETAKIYEIDGIKIMGLNGIYSSKFKNSEQYFTKNDIELCKKAKCDIFISHESPNNIDLEIRGRKVGTPFIRDIIEVIKPKLSFHGHHHTKFETNIGETKVICLPKLYYGYYLLDTKNFTTTFVPFEREQRQKDI